LQEKSPLKSLLLPKMKTKNSEQPSSNKELPQQKKPPKRQSSRKRLKLH
jgi:hypothetical protein